MNSLELIMCWPAITRPTSRVLAILSMMVLAGIQLPGLALPGQPFATVRRSIASNSIWQGESLERSLVLDVAYRISTPLQDGRLALEVMTSPITQKSSLETLEVQDPRSVMEFSRNGGEGLSLVRQVWGEAIANDFANSRFTDDLKDVRFDTPAKFFKGERYGYQTGITLVNLGNSQQSVRHTFTVIALEDWDRRVNFYRSCNRNPDEWECKVTL